MIYNYKLDKSFGPVGSTTGVFIFLAGLIMLYHSYYAIILILFGAFLAFTSTSTQVDFDNNCVKFSNNIFGIIKIGTWIQVTSEMRIGITKSDKMWRTYSRSNRILDTEIPDYRLVLYDDKGFPLLTIQKQPDYKKAKEELEKLSTHLQLQVY